MTRFKITLEYDGASFVGWQRQTNGLSVQEVVETALHHLTQDVISVTGAGRTDAGVHALAQVAHFDVRKPLDANTVREGLNAHMRPHCVVVRAAQKISGDFHARFDATRRRYVYRILNRRPPPALDKGKVWHVPRQLAHDTMHRQAQALVGTHDFSTFRDAQCQAKSPIKTLDDVCVQRLSEEIHITCTARSFLHRQVRSIVGTLVEVGAGKMAAGQVGRILAARDRTLCGPVAPAHGLYLERITYPQM